MTEVVLALYETLEDANASVRDLVEAGFDRGDIGLAVREEGKELSSDFMDEDDVKGGEGAGFGALVGGLTGIVAGLTAIIVPGIGPIIAAGPLAAALGGAAGAAIGAAAGAVTGGITASLVNMGVPDEFAQYYAESVRRGGALVTVTTHENVAETAVSVLRRHHPIDVERRAAQWRKTGWKGFDPLTEPFTAVELEEQTYFEGDDDTVREGDNSVRRYPVDRR